MKFNQILLIILALLLNVALSVQTNAKNKAHMKMKSRSRSRSRSRSHSRSKKPSYMDYMNTFFGEAADSLDKKKDVDEENQENNQPKSMNNKEYRFKETLEKRRRKKNNEETEEDEERGNKEGSISKNELFKIQEKKEIPKPILEEFFMISSNAFLNRELYPSVHIEKKKFWTIKTDVNNYRINDAWKKTETTEKGPSERFFYFRLSGLNLYYTNTKSDLNILGVISVRSMDKIMSPKLDATTEYITTCFLLTDIQRQKYKICGMEEKTVKHWYCQIKSFLGEKDEEICANLDESIKIITKTIEINQPLVIVPTPSPFCNQKWNYQNWGDDWECDCAEGREQSPIDLPKIEETIQTDVAPLFRYNKVKARDQDPTVDETFSADKKALRLELKENLLRIFHPDMGKLITIDGAVYNAEEIIIHTPAEHTINGKQYDMEISVVHYGVTQGDIAKQATLNFLFERSPGSKNPFIEDLNYFSLPGALHKTANIEDMIYINKINVKPEDVGDITSLEPFAFYTYQGSLSFPPCTENTVVYVTAKPLKIGSVALELFQEATRIPDLMDNRGNVIISDWKKETARKTQSLNGRPIFNHKPQDCGRPKKPKRDPGHYEKIRKAITSYFYVNNMVPSGLSGAMVVSEDEAKGKGNRPNIGHSKTNFVEEK